MDSSKDGMGNSAETPSLGPMPAFPRIDVHDKEKLNGMDVKELRQVVWEMTEGIAIINQSLDDVMSQQLRISASYQEELYRAKEEIQSLRETINQNSKARTHSTAEGGASEVTGKRASKNVSKKEK